MSLVWVKLEDAGDAPDGTYRAKVLGGWLIRVETYFLQEGPALGLTFYPDPEHEWDGSSLS